VSITRPSEDSPLEYFRGKARLERALGESGVPHTILRPAVFFGGADILVNNIAWALRHLPVFGVFGSGDYRLQPIHVDDFASLAVNEGRRTENRTVDATGPETFSFRGLVESLGEIVGSPRPIVSVPPSVGYLATSILGMLLRDVMLTREEIDGLMADLLATDAPPAGTTHWSRQRMARRVGAPLAESLARLCLAFAHLLHGRPWYALRHGSEALELAEAHGDEQTLKYALLLLGEAYKQGGKMNVARECFELLQRTYYPGMAQVPEMLLGVDVCRVINLRA